MTMPEETEINLYLLMIVQLPRCAFSLFCYNTSTEPPDLLRLTKCQNDHFVCYAASLLDILSYGCSLKFGNFDGIGTTLGILYFCNTDGCNGEGIFSDIRRQYGKYNVSGLTIDDSGSARSLWSVGDNGKAATRFKRGQKQEMRIDFVDYVIEGGADMPRPLTMLMVPMALICPFHNG